MRKKSIKQVPLFSSGGFHAPGMRSGVRSGFYNRRVRCLPLRCVKPAGNVHFVNGAISASILQRLPLFCVLFSGVFFTFASQINT